MSLVATSPVSAMQHVGMNPLGCARLLAVLLLTGCGGGSSQDGNTGQSGGNPPPPAPPPQAGLSVLTYHNDNARDGLNARETVLTTTNVNSSQFGNIGFLPVDGLVDAQPLYLASVTIGGSTHSVLYVASEHDSVYAFDAGSGVVLWRVSLLGAGETPSDDRGCGQVTPEIGVTATPVIDPSAGPHGTLFVVAMSKNGSGTYFQRLHALDAATGTERSTPVTVQAKYPGSGDNSSGGFVVF